LLANLFFLLQEATGIPYPYTPWAGIPGRQKLQHCESSAYTTIHIVKWSW